MPIVKDIYYQFFEGRPPGVKPPLILIHGAAGNHLYWPHEIRRLPGSRVYALDLPAHGKSPGQARQTISAYAGSILDWLTAMEISKAVIVGHSMGAAIALQLALDYPERMAGMVLLGAGARLRVSPEILRAAESETTYLNAVRILIDSSFSNTVVPRLKELAEKRMAEVRASVLYADFRACDRFDVIGKLSTIHKPTLILCGEYDLLTPLRYSYYLAEQIPEAKLMVIPHTGHMLQLERPDQVAEAVRDFLVGIQI